MSRVTSEKVLRLGASIAQAKQDLANAKPGSTRFDRLKKRLQELQQQRRSVMGGLARVASRKDPARDARIAFAYPQLKGTRGAVSGLARSEGISTQQVRRIAAKALRTSREPVVFAAANPAIVAPAMIVETAHVQISQPEPLAPPTASASRLDQIEARVSKERKRGLEVRHQTDRDAKSVPKRLEMLARRARQRARGIQAGMDDPAWLRTLSDDLEELARSLNAFFFR